MTVGVRREMVPSFVGLKVEVKNTFVHFSENLRIDPLVSSRSRSSPPVMRDAEPAPPATKIATEFATATKHDPCFPDADEDTQGSSADGDDTSNAASSDNQTDGCTTVMLRNIPCRCKTEEVMEAITKFGFKKNGLFFYMPVKTGGSVRKNFGYAFVGFYNPLAAKKFGQAIDGQKLFPERTSSKMVSVVPAHAQGLSQTIQRFNGEEPIWLSCSMTSSMSPSTQRKRHANSKGTRSNAWASAERMNAFPLTCGAWTRPT